MSTPARIKVRKKPMLRGWSTVGDKQATQAKERSRALYEVNRGLLQR